jgi:hypothetical protein
VYVEFLTHSIACRSGLYIKKFKISSFNKLGIKKIPDIKNNGLLRIDMHCFQETKNLAIDALVRPIPRPNKDVKFKAIINPINECGKSARLKVIKPR